jgi:hypothetical protein
VAGEYPAPPIVEEVLRSPGQPLDTPTRTFFESRFGHEFSRVRVHTDAKAAASARAVSAHAYTVGPDVVLAEGRYAPGSASGRRLLAHELAHVVQQGSAPPTHGVHAEAATAPVRFGRLSTAARLQRQLDPNQLFCAAVCAICAGTLIAPELIIPEIACALCLRKCAAGQASAPPTESENPTAVA